MTLYTVVPHEVIWGPGPLGQEGQPTARKELRIGRVLMEVEPAGEHEAKIVRLLHCDLSDYLNPAYAPGSLISYTPSIRQNKT